MVKERGFNPEKIGADIINFPITRRQKWNLEIDEKTGLYTQVEVEPLSGEERRKVLTEIFEIDKTLAELEFDVRLLGEAVETV